ncbi:terpenoid cyclases/Protein prenyltransferase [Auricularia subglabra TFB-10046 SS5]|nr:terpenoid cyclases/Protein prenyltransferase [Auricularia subglabra TFB-10046 SS5]
MAEQAHPEPPKLQRAGHASHCIRCIQSLAPSHVEFDTSRMAVGFYCIASLELLGVVEQKLKEHEREDIRRWIWAQYIRGPYGSGFRAGSSMAPAPVTNPYSAAKLAEYDFPDLIMTYVALLLLCILRDDFSQLDRNGLSQFLGSCQRDDGSFTMSPDGVSDADLRTMYCAFAIASMLDDWSHVNISRAVKYIQRCRTYEGGYGQTPGQEATPGGTTFCAVASLAMAAEAPGASLTEAEQSATVRWLALKQRAHEGGFSGRTEKVADACYSFWCGAALAVLGRSELVDATRNNAFLASCQFKYGGIAKASNEHPDPFHTYMALASLAIYPSYGFSSAGDDDTAASWKLASMDPVLNATVKTAAWAWACIPSRNASTGVGLSA